MLSKESKIRVLENFYGLDYIFFGKPVSKYDSCCPVVKEEYTSMKGAFLSVYVEMLKLIDHNPNTIMENVDSTNLYNMAKKSAIVARTISESVVKTERCKENIKTSLKEALVENNKIDVPKFTKNKIQENAYSIAIDNMLIARALTESNSIEKLNEWEGQILEDSYKILRDGLVEWAMTILNDEDE